MGIIDGKRVVITGASKGIGLATALHLHDEGAAVVATVNSTVSPELEQLADSSDRFFVRQVDVTQEDQVRDLVEFAVEKLGGLDGIVNNAGILIPNTLEDSTNDDYDKTFDVNVRGVYFGCKYALPELRRAGGGAIVNFGSINSAAGEPLLALYSASKGAVLMLTKNLAIEHGKENIRANCVMPGFVDTDLNVPHWSFDGSTHEDQLAGVPDFQPIGRPIEPLEIATTVSFLLSDRSSAMTGVAFNVDGGVLAQA